MSGKGAPILVLHKVKTFLDYGQTKISYKNIRRMEADKERLIRVRKYRNPEVDSYVLVVRPPHLSPVLVVS